VPAVPDAPLIVSWVEWEVDGRWDLRGADIAVELCFWS
jgi:hypothetical protein